MTEFFVKLLGLLEGWVGSLPDLSVDSGVVSKMVSSMDRIVEFVSVANFIIPLDHIFFLIGLVYLVRSRKFLVAVINWVIRRIADFFP